jgi:type VI secretion system protein ImpA
MLDLEAALSETKDSPPCGPNLEHDLSFFELEQAAQGRPEQVVGTTVKPGEDPKWPKVADLSQQLLVRSKDLRVAVYLTRAMTRTEGFPGLAAGLTLILGLLDRYWAQVHPVLEADHGGDPTERLSSLAPLTGSDALIKDLRDTLLIDSRVHGQVQAREVEVALGRLAPPPGAGPGYANLGEISAKISATFATDLAIPSALNEARERALAIETLVSDRIGPAFGFDLKPLLQCLSGLLDACEAALGTPGPVAATSTSAGAVSQPSDGQRVPVGGEIRTREDAARVLDAVCAFLERNEPSNPAPLLIRRAQRLMLKNFVEIVKDIMPDSLSQIERLAGELEQK